MRIRIPVSKRTKKIYNTFWLIFIAIIILLALLGRFNII